MQNCEFAKEARKDILTMLYTAGESHIGSCFSCVDIMSVLYNSVMNFDPKNPNMENRDKFLLGKGHAVAALYAVLARSGYFPLSELELYCKNGTDYQGHSRRDFIPGIEVSAGSLGHALSIGTGMAYANRLNKNSGRIFVLMGDGECNEGSVWESAMFAAKFRLSNLIAIVDRNMLQSYGSDEQVLDMGDLGSKFASFGFNVLDVDGHNYELLERTLNVPNKNEMGRPTMVIAHTVKGKGISFMENKLEWHFFSPKKEHFEKGIEELKNER